MTAVTTSPPSGPVEPAPTGEGPAAIPLPAIFDRLSDRLNPVLVREVRQALKGRRFLWTFQLLLLGSWLASVAGLALAGESLEYGRPAMAFFTTYYYVLTFAALVIVPLGAFGSVLSEYDENTQELLSITSLSPSTVVTGKLLGAVAQLVMFLAAIAPFVAFTTLLQGFDPFGAAWALAVAAYVSVVASMAAVTLGTVWRGKQRKAFANLVLTAGLLLLWQVLTTGVSAAILQGIPYFDPEFLIPVVLFTAASASYFLLFHQIAVARLTFDSGNRSTGVRVVGLLQVVALWAVVYGGHFFASPGTWSVGSEGLIFFGTVSVLHASLFGLFATTEPERLSNRVTRDLPRSRMLRLAAAPFMPGGGRGLIFLLLLLAVAFVGSELCIAQESAATRARGGGDWASVRLFTMLVTGYAAGYLAAGSGVTAYAGNRNRRFKPQHARLVVGTGISLCAIMPFVFVAIAGVVDRSYDVWRFHPVMITNPVSTLGHLNETQWGDQWLVMTVAVAGWAAVLLSVRRMAAGVKEVMTAPRTDEQADLSVDAKLAVDGATT
ncbi:MAG: hypothetical protein AAF532_00595 [Planctomycetota bacterium]